MPLSHILKISLSEIEVYNTTDRIASGATRTYNFGFIGKTAISITSEEGVENTKAIFKGDNSGYEVAPTISVSEVEFGANDSLFQFTKTYIHGVFSAGNFTNTIPAGAEVKFTDGFTLGKGHTLVVRGTLIG